MVVKKIQTLELRQLTKDLSDFYSTKDVQNFHTSLILYLSLMKVGQPSFFHDIQFSSLSKIC